ncbi:MAG: DNA cytosine methyltransferase [Xanthobacteraceae bacterium]|nr:DNA cytosine methyltransferase [Xanthobacteraceae bacterium]
MNGRALYIEIDEYCRAWLRNLIAADLICPGDVVGDILDVRPRDLDRYNQVHAFAGIGIWSGSLRDAGIRDNDYVWTGSCPCQPFSAAGQRGGFADERHLWPAFFHLIKECRPPVVLGEQVASPDGLQWFDLVSSDLEGADYAIGAADLCAAGIAVAAGETEVGQPTLEWIRRAVQSCPDPFLAAELRDYAEWFDREAGIGPPHIRQRLCWMAYADQGQRGRFPDREGCEPDRAPAGRQQGDGEPEPGRAVGGMADSDGRYARAERQQRGWQYGQQPQDGIAGAWSHPDSLMGNTDDAGSQGRGERRNGADQRLAGPTSLAGWTRADWIICTDGKARPIEPGTFPLAHGQSNRVGRLRAYGNAMHRAKITQFILAAQEAIGAPS